MRVETTYCQEPWHGTAKPNMLARHGTRNLGTARHMKPWHGNMLARHATQNIGTARARKGMAGHGTDMPASITNKKHMQTQPFWKGWPSRALRTPPKYQNGVSVVPALWYSPLTSVGRCRALGTVSRKVLKTLSKTSAVSALWHGPANTTLPHDGPRYDVV